MTFRGSFRSGAVAATAGRAGSGVALVTVAYPCLAPVRPRGSSAARGIAELRDDSSCVSYPCLAPVRSRGDGPRRARPQSFGSLGSCEGSGGECRWVFSIRSRAHSSAGERPLHTREVPGSIPGAPIVVSGFVECCFPRLASYRAAQDGSMSMSDDLVSRTLLRPSSPIGRARANLHPARQ